jgi:hypothetical protein
LNPLNLADPLGLWNWKLTGTVLGGLGTAVGVVAIVMAFTPAAGFAPFVEMGSIGLSAAAATVDCIHGAATSCAMDAAAVISGGTGLNLRLSKFVKVHSQRRR